jgi:hypothetical protein
MWLDLFPAIFPGERFQPANHPEVEEGVVPQPSQQVDRLHLARVPAAQLEAGAQLQVLGGRLRRHSLLVKRKRL